MDDMQAQIATTLAADDMMARKPHTDYNWSSESAVWQVSHGGPTARTQAALAWLDEQIELINSDMSLKRIAGGLLDEMMHLRGMSGLDVIAR